MPETIIVQNNFTAGELSPRLFGRSDLATYRNGLREQQNLITQKHGGLLRRSGARFVAEAFDSENGFDRLVRVIEFQFSTQQTYILEFGHQYIRFYRDRGQLRHGTIHTVTAPGATHVAGVSTITIGNHGIAVGQQISVKGILTADAGFPIGYDGTFIVTSTTATTVDYAQAVAPPGAYVSGGTVTLVVGTVPTQIATPYRDIDLSLLKWAQSADVLFLAHPLYEPRKLERSSGADNDSAVWSLNQLNPKHGPYLAENTDTTATLNVTVGAIGVEVAATLNDPAVLLINGGLGFVSTDVGRTVTWFDTALWRWGVITDFTDRKTVKVTLEVASLGNAVSGWRMGAWSDTDGWPFCCTFHDDRLQWGGTPALPQTVFASVIGDFDNYQPFNEVDGSPRASDAYSFTINDNKVNTIHWLVSDTRGLIAFTNGGGFQMAAVGNEGISATAPPLVKNQTTEPASQVAQPHRIGGVTLQPASSDRKILEFIFTDALAQFIAPDLTILSEHITIGGITDTALQIEPDNILWSVRNDGVLLSMTYERSEKVVAWGRHIIGGTLAGESNAKVESVAVIRDGSDDLVWMVVKRTINSLTKRYIEFLEPLFDEDVITEDGFFVDSGITLDSLDAVITGATTAKPVVITATAHGLSSGDRIKIRDVKGMTELNDISHLIAAATANTFELNTTAGAEVDGTGFTAYVSGGGVYKEVQQITGLDHLAGETVKVLADGGTHGDKVVSSGGAVALDRFSSVVHAGLAFTYKMRTLPLVSGLDREGRGQFMRIGHATARFHRSLGGDLGSHVKDPIVHREPADLMDAPPPLFSGRKPLAVSARYDQDADVILEGSDPHPMNLLSLEIKAGVEGI